MILKNGYEFRVPKMDKGFQSSTCVGVSSQIYDQASVQLQRCRQQSMRIRCLQLSPEILCTALKYTHARTHAHTHPQFFTHTFTNSCISRSNTSKNFIYITRTPTHPPFMFVSPTFPLTVGVAIVNQKSISY